MSGRWRAGIALALFVAARSAEFFAVGLAHAVDYLAVFLLLALFAFRRRSLLPPG